MFNLCLFIFKYSFSWLRTTNNLLGCMWHDNYHSGRFFHSKFLETRKNTPVCLPVLFDLAKCNKCRQRGGLFSPTCIHSGSMVGPGDVRFSRCPVLSYVNTVPAALYSPFHWMVQPPFRKYLLGLSLRSARKLPASATSSMRMSRAPSGIRPMST